MRRIRAKLCKVCKKEFSPRNSLQKVCSMDCALAHSRQDTAKQRRRADRVVAAAKRKSNREAKAKLKTLSQWLAEAQAQFNKFIRERDIEEPCISCGRHHSGQYHAGHYRTTKAMPELRFSEVNCHKQCAPCNNHKSGNLVDYRIRLVKKIGVESLDWLEGPHQAQHLTIDDAIEIKQYYRDKLRELNR